jgi:hypothetical protein
VPGSYKCEATAEEIATGFMALVLWSDDSHDVSVEKQVRDAQGDWERVQAEIQYLRIFAVDYTVYLNLGDTTEKNAVLDAFYDHLLRLAQQTGSSNTYWEDLKDRLFLYAQTANMTDEENPLPAIGSAFAELCGCPMTLYVTGLGAIEFGSICKGVSKMLNDFRLIL